MSFNSMAASDLAICQYLATSAEIKPLAFKSYGKQPPFSWVIATIAEAIRPSGSNFLFSSAVTRSTIRMDVTAIRQSPCRQLPCRYIAKCRYLAAQNNKSIWSFLQPSLQIFDKKREDVFFFAAANYFKGAML